MLATFRRHWPEYSIESFALAVFMLSASAFASALEHPASPLRHAIDAPIARRACMGLAMGLTAVAIIYSPLGKRSGAHMNPAVTLTFLALGKVKLVDALFYVAFQLLGGVVGVSAAALLLHPLLGDPSVNYVVTVPGTLGRGVAFAAELTISFVLMSVVLWSASTPRLERATGAFAGLLVATYITFEAPLSGMSMNPARTLGSALLANEWHGFWIYASAPLFGMLAAALVHARCANAASAHCAKLHHVNSLRCIFCGKNG